MKNVRHIKHEKLNALYAPYKNCKQCPLGFLGRKQVVFGEGNPNTKLLFVGEAPGREEDELGRPFVGRSGQLLNRLIESIGYKREDVYITNVVKCRPPGNRKPTALETNTCKTILLFKQIDIIQPHVICTLGAAPLEGFLDHPVKITKMRGIPLKWQGITILPAFHPAYILRNQTKLEVLYNDLAKAFELAYR